MSHVRFEARKSPATKAESPRDNRFGRRRRAQIGARSCRVANGRPCVIDQRK
jgi:hypothetical protein